LVFVYIDGICCFKAGVLSIVVIVEATIAIVNTTIVDIVVLIATVINIAVIHIVYIGM